jgi:DDE superfamily endonuclease
MFPALSAFAANAGELTALRDYDLSPDGMQHLLSRAKWDADGVCDAVRSYLIEHIGDPAALLVVDETGALRRAPPPYWPAVLRGPVGSALCRIGQERLEPLCRAKMG